MTVALRPGVAAVHAASCDHALHCMAGFFASEAQAQAVAQQLRQRHGLQADQGLLLGPAHASRLSFARQARSWSHGRLTEEGAGLSDAPLMATLGGFVVGLCILIGMALDGVPDDGLTVLLLLLMGPMAGAMAGWTASALTASPAQQRRFNRHIRCQLAAGGWVVLAHHLPSQEQAGAAALLRARSAGWCAVYAPWRVL